MRSISDNMRLNQWRKYNRSMCHRVIKRCFFFPFLLMDCFFFTGNFKFTIARTKPVIKSSSQKRSNLDNWLTNVYLTRDAFHGIMK